MGIKKKEISHFENAATVLWLAMDILWSYDLFIIPSILGAVSAILQYIHLYKQEDLHKTTEAAASFFWIGANLLWLLEMHVAKTFYLIGAVVATILVIKNHGKLKRGT